MSEISQVVKIDYERGRPVRVEIRVGNIFFRFCLEQGKLQYTKKKPDAQIYDPAQLWIPDDSFRKICRQAAAILNGRKVNLA